MTSSKKAKLPSEAEMMKRLRGVLGHEDWVTDLYPFITKYHGQQKTAREIVRILTTAMDECAKLEHVKKKYPDAKRLLYRLLDNFVVALITDEDVRNEALDLVASLRQ